MIPRGICGGQSGSGIGVLPITYLLPYQRHSAIAALLFINLRPTLYNLMDRPRSYKYNLKIINQYFGATEFCFVTRRH